MARLVVKALEALSDRERRSVLLFLIRDWLSRSPGPVDPALAGASAEAAGLLRGAVPGEPRMVLGPPLPTTMELGPHHQMLPVRLPSDQYSRLKDWCSEHGFSMATVIRVLVDRFLEAQERRST